MEASLFIAAGIVTAAVAGVALLLRRFHVPGKTAAGGSAQPDPPTPASAYAVAVAATAFAVFIRWLVAPWLGDTLPFVTVFGAVAAGVWVGGYRPAWVATALGYLACAYFFIEPRGLIPLQTPRDYIGLVLYLFTCATIIALGEGMRVAQGLAHARERELRESEERLRLAQSGAHIGTFDWNIQSGVNRWSPELEAMYGLKPGEFGGTQASWEQLVHPQDREEMIRRVNAAMTHGNVEGEWRIVLPDGTVRWIAGRACVFKDEHGKPVRLIGANFDVTERRQAEEALKEADRRKTEFLAMLAHELRNPLAPISNALQLIRRTGADADTVQTATEMMERQVSQIIRLVDDLLDVSRITRGKMELRKERVDLTSILKHAVDLARPVCDKSELELSVQLPEAPLYLDADAIRLSQVIGNLLSNACKFTERGGQVRLIVEPDAKHVVIRVQDTGIGIAAEQLSSIFDMFAQVDSSLQRSQGGLGIGLTLAKTLVEMHGGSIEAYSGGLGQGSEFVVRLPLVNEVSAPESPAPASIAAPPASRRQILVVDDNVDAAESLAMLLQAAGHDVHIAHDGLEAVDRAAALRPDLILLDIGLPQLDGYESARRIRQQPGGQDVVLVALTGWGQEEDRRRSAEAGFDGHLVKPVEYDALLQLVASVRRGDS